MNYLWVFLLITGLIAFVVILEMFSTRCPACRKMFARKIISSAGGTEYRTTRDRVTISGNRLCKCKYCGHEWTQRYTRSRKR